jgi:hypothetical protein
VIFDHTGKWIRAVWVMTRLQEGTRQWGCCGSTERFSLECPSLEARRQRQLQLLKEEEEAMKNRARAEQAAQQR